MPLCCWGRGRGSDKKQMDGVGCVFGVCVEHVLKTVHQLSKSCEVAPRAQTYLDVPRVCVSFFKNV